MWMDGMMDEGEGDGEMTGCGVGWSGEGRLGERSGICHARDIGDQDDVGGAVIGVGSPTMSIGGDRGGCM